MKTGFLIAFFASILTTTFTFAQEKPSDLNSKNLKEVATKIPIEWYGSGEAKVLAKKELQAKGVRAMVIDMHALKPFDEKLVLKAAALCGCIITVEEHSIYGGLGSAVAEIVSQNYPVKMKIIGIPDVNVINAEPLEIFEYYGLTASKIFIAALDLLK